MRLLALAVRDFRNLERVEVEPSPDATVAAGQNGQGKTNLLEALYYLATLKPLRAARLAELIRFGADQARVEGRFLIRGAERAIAVEVSSAGTRQAYVDGKRAESLEDYFGGVSVVAFTPDDLAVVKGAPEGRRALLDRAVFNRFPSFLKESRDYSRALKSRNRLLRDSAPDAYLSAYDETLARLGARIWMRRRQLLCELAPLAEKAFAAIGRIDSPARYRYSLARLHPEEHSLPEPQLCTRLGEALRARLPHDRDRAFTSVGPHADDLAIELGDQRARAFASQGQQRALVLAWKIAEVENLLSSLGYLPLLLLDDVSSELDPDRNAFLMDYLARCGAQCFLTTTEPALVRRAASPSARWLSVRAGTVSPSHPPASQP
ncbi:MAG: DNA replication/repair protein RecF [Myxococcales bacterium]|nr:DNA replication/repair protein RecF [Myxococcales bacterium]